MNALEFETEIHDGIVKIPTQYTSWQEKSVRVILLEVENRPTSSKSLKFEACSIKTKSYRFNREQANER
ncbi:hypothetical protein BegalDRAFT_0985 [Beggiatoa alba B18LD]|uniref:Uncharacterized protein n=1 Tax=Beggiatoa alba B18LD TaxID=395493 RepID=I3CE46_9GAMM|nr:hypothetical protein [Beggiatoa alba]EIJ41889.1 hypothetical protein BegalDRAFT_0985 [Beggiatoa alba B18LD]